MSYDEVVKKQLQVIFDLVRNLEADLKSFDDSFKKENEKYCFGEFPPLKGNTEDPSLLNCRACDKICGDII